MKATTDIGLALALLVSTALLGCSPDGPPDRWLEQCESDRDCGSLLCLDGVCTVTCRSAEECAKSPDVTARCSEARSEDAEGSFPGVCAAADGAASTGLTSQLDAVPSCPEPGRTTGLPGVVVPFPEAPLSYSGDAVVASVAAHELGFTDTLVVLETVDPPGVALSLRFRVSDGGPGSVLADLLPSGASVSMTVESGGSQNLKYVLLVLRDEQQRLLIAHHAGADQLYRAGLFATAETAGFALELTPTCRSSVGFGCFEHQSQAEYSGTFGADERVTIETYKPAQISVGGSDYTVDFSAVSVDGGKALCSDVAYPGRYLAFTVLPVPPR